MRRGSVIALAAAGLMLGVAVVSATTWQPDAKSFDKNFANQMLDRVKTAVANQDADTLTGYMAPSCRVFERDKSTLQPIVGRILKDIGPNSLILDFSNVSVATPKPGSAVVSFHLDVHQRLPKATVSYLKCSMKLYFGRHREPILYGLALGDFWRVEQVESDPTFTLPTI